LPAASAIAGAAMRIPRDMRILRDRVRLVPLE